MSKFNIRKKLSLDFLGKEWTDCYLEFNSPSVREINEALFEIGDVEDAKKMSANFEKTLKILRSNFVSGKAVSDKGLVDVVKADLEDFPMEVITKALDFLVAGSDQKE